MGSVVIGVLCRMQPVEPCCAQHDGVLFTTVMGYGGSVVIGVLLRM